MKSFSLRKKLAFTVILVTSALVMIELSLHLIYLVSHRGPFPFGEHQEALLSLAAASDESSEEMGDRAAGQMRFGPQDVEVIHPFLGFVKDPDQTARSSYLGFPGKDDDPLSPAVGDALTVAIFGGSFAEGVSWFGEPALQSALIEAGIESRILTIAMGGYKQPQQLLALAYLLSHGAEIDVVVNIDGFNEVTLPVTDNLSRGVNPYYPRAWKTRTAGMADQETMRLIGRVTLLRDKRQHWAKLFRPLPRFSIVRNIVWRARDQDMEEQIEDLNEEIGASRRKNRKGFMRSGPDMGFESGPELYPEIARHWSRCSQLMKALCDAKGITYLHFLQPNQYFDTGRVLTDEEQRIAFREEHAYRHGVVEGYPQLRNEAANLIAQGVDYHDLTSLFDEYAETLYSDECCHTNPRGYEIVANAIAAGILDSLNSKPAAIADSTAAGEAAP